MPSPRNGVMVGLRVGVRLRVSKCINEYVCLIDVMYPATLHGVGVITKPFFAIFAAFMESMTSNLAQRSFKVSNFCINRKRAYILLLVVNSNLDPIMHCFRDTAVLMSKVDNFPYPTPIPSKISGCFLWSRSVMSGYVHTAVCKAVLFSRVPGLMSCSSIKDSFIDELIKPGTKNTSTKTCHFDSPLPVCICPDSSHCRR